MNPLGSASNTDVPVPLSFEHSCCTLRRLGLLATLPHSASVVFAHGSLFGNPATVTVGPVYSSATFGARVATCMPPRKLTYVLTPQLASALNVFTPPAVL